MKRFRDSGSNLSRSHDYLPLKFFATAKSMIGFSLGELRPVAAVRGHSLHPRLLLPHLGHQPCPEDVGGWIGTAASHLNRYFWTWENEVQEIGYLSEPWKDL